MKLKGVVRLAVAAAVVLAGLWVRGGAAAGFLPESSWGNWRSEEVEHWSVHVRVNTWSHAAEADLHYGKAEDTTLKAYGASDSYAADLEPVRFTLSPGGTLTVTRLAPNGAGAGGS
ncbi:hypothetical protein [Kitasatospora sp. NPDC085879]|uniref:hypothetical protein n=1 Tax=Kitasatospora sp. NPDC085879 TaxID=3154769 RepID=UPI0034244429